MKIPALLLAVTMTGTPFVSSDPKDYGSKPAKQQKLCTMKGVPNSEYSPGAIVPKGDGFIICTPHGKWRRATNADMGRGQKKQPSN
jgi:hypothetical protein